MLIGENKVKSVNSTNISSMCGQAASDAYTALCGEAPWSWGERIVTPSEWGPDYAKLDENVADVKRVYFNGRELRYMSTADILSQHVYNGHPSFWSYLGRELYFSPFPNEPEAQLKIKLLVQYHNYLDPTRDDEVVDIPRELEYLLVLRACMSMASYHVQDANMANSFGGEYARLLTQMKHRFTTSQKSNSAIA